MVILLIYLIIFLIEIKSEDHEYKNVELYLETPCGVKAAHLRKNLSCLSLETYDIPYVDDDSPFSDNTIFFIETTCNGVLNYRQTCSVEAAARAHPQRQVIVLFAGPVSLECLSESPMWEILTYKNVNIFRINIKKYLKGTLFESLLENGALIHNRFPIINLSNVLRIVTLYKYGGLYLDLDVVVTGSLDSLKEPKNWIAKEDYNVIGTALISARKFGLGKQMTAEMIRALSDRFTICSWDYNCTRELTKVFNTICNTQVVDEMSKIRCQGFEVYPYEYFYPIRKRHWRTYFTRKYENMFEDAYAFHLWNHLSMDETLYDDSLYGQIMRKYCPKIFKVLIENRH